MRRRMLRRMSTTTTLGPAGFQGRLIRPGDHDYDVARRVYNAMIDRHPALIARCTDAADVARAIAFARDNELPLAVRGGGHHGAGLGTLRRRRRRRPVAAARRPGRPADPHGAGRRRRTLAEVDRATHEHGLATAERDHRDHRRRRHHARRRHRVPDALVRAVDRQPAGRRGRAGRPASGCARAPTSTRDLFWAIRGGGGNFGVVTEFEFRLHPVDTVVGRPDVLARRAAAPRCCRPTASSCPQAPRELYGFFAFATVPPADPFPSEIHLRKVCGVVWHYRGDADGAARDDGAAARRAARRRCCTASQPMPHPAMQGAFDALYPAGDQWYWRADFVDEIPDAAVELHAHHGAELPTMKSTMHLYPVDGAAHDVGVRRHGLELPRRDVAPPSTPASIPTRPTPTSSGTGASTTTRRCTRTRPAAPT